MRNKLIRTCFILQALFLGLVAFGSAVASEAGGYYNVKAVVPVGVIPDVSITVPRSGTVASVLKQTFKGTGIKTVVHPLFARHTIDVVLEAGTSEKLDAAVLSLAESGDFTWSYTRHRFTVVHYGRFTTQVPEAVVKQGSFTKKLRELGASNVFAGWHGRVTFKATPKVLAEVASFCEQERVAQAEQAPVSASSERSQPEPEAENDKSVQGQIPEDISDAGAVVSLFPLKP